MTDDRAATSEEALTRELYRALAEGDAEALAALLHPSFVGETTEGLPLGLGGTHTGPEAMARDVWWTIGRHYRARAEPESFLPLAEGADGAGGGLLVLGRYTGTAREGGAVLDAAFAHVLRFVDGRISRLAQYTDSARWAQALPETPSGRRTLRVVEYAVDGAVATIRLRRPGHGNAIDAALVEDLYEAVFRAGADARVRAVLLCGAGPTFTTGGDLEMFAGVPREEMPDRLRQMIDVYHLALERLRTLDAPVVCAVRGAAAGGGLGMVHVADVVVAAEDAKFALGYAAIGLASDGFNSWYLPRVVGLRRAQQMFLLNRALTGTEALQWGLVSEVLPGEEVEDRARALAERLAAGPTQAFGRMKCLLRDALSTELPAQAVAEVTQMSAAGASDDAAEGITAFRARRRPQFRGR